MINESIKNKIIKNYISNISIEQIIKKYNIPCNEIIESIKDTSKWKNYIKKINENNKNNDVDYMFKNLKFINIKTIDSLEYLRDLESFYNTKYLHRWKNKYHFPNKIGFYYFDDSLNEWKLLLQEIEIL